MKESVYKSYEELPLFLNARIVAQVLGIAPSSAYELMTASSSSGNRWWSCNGSDDDTTRYR